MGLTFLDMVRRLGELTLAKCGDGACDAGLHRQEAARHLGAILEDRKLMYELWKREDWSDASVGISDYGAKT